MPRKKEPELIEEQTVPYGFIFKISLLGVLIFLGVFVFSRIPHDTKKNAAEIDKSQTLKAIRNVGIKAQDFLGNTDKRAGFVDGLKSVGDDVLGETAKAADSAVEKTTDTFLDVIYENTLEKVIRHLVDRLPERQKENYIERLCSDEGCKSKN